MSPQKPSTPHQKPLSSTPKTPQFSTLLSSTLKTAKFNTLLSSTWKTPSVPHQKRLSSTPKTPQFRCVELRSFCCGTEGCVEQRGFGVELRGLRCRTEGWVELRGFWCWIEEFWVLKRCGPCVELRGVCVELMSSPDKLSRNSNLLRWPFSTFIVS